MTTFVDALPAHAAPPQTRARHAENRAFADELRANPGRYAEYPHDVVHLHGLRHRINHGKDAAFGRGFDAQIRNGVVYVAYTGK
ncbi:hypothetical protein GS982_21260 [Rhodococcus hoagii]|nr:hypothetical protein [Prescottella equi]NKZ84460.1 hypothetical protein [Prescottella equi]NKZ84609.1 hypothetical protein [Prescottella equi]NKZ84715.1 hypothetical protein [Prescottella equi]